MTDLIELFPVARTRPDLPIPILSRWQPLRIGLVELFRYDTEEFWFRDGHLLLRGNNGTGKSKVLALTLPFLFDARLAPSRIEPDGDPNKRMAWNLLLGSYDRRVGYTWIELGRVAEDGTPHYLTLGAGLSAAAARPGIESWFFVLENAAGLGDGPRIGQDLWLTSPQRIVLSKEKLREQLEGRGQVFETGESYRRAVDERLFHLGTARYAALMDTLVQLRQPQLSKKPDEGSLSNALTEALPPLATDLLGDVADALNRLEEDRRQLEEYQALERAVGGFHQRYRLYAGTQSRRQARGVRQAQTEFDNASRALNEIHVRLQSARENEAHAQTEHDRAGRDLAGRRVRLDTLRSDPAMQDANRLDNAAKDVAARRRDVEAANIALETASDRLRRASEETRRYAALTDQAERALTERRRDAAERAEVVGVTANYAANPLASLDPELLPELTPAIFDAAQSRMRAAITERREQIALVRQRRAELMQAEAQHQYRREAFDERQEDAGKAGERRGQADADAEREAVVHLEAWGIHLGGLRQLQVSSEAALRSLADWVVNPIGDNPARTALQAAQQETSRRLAARQIELDTLRQVLEQEGQGLEDERRRLEAGEDSLPPAPHTRDAGARIDRTGAPLWQLIDFRDHVDAGSRAGLEAALEASGVLDAWVAPDGQLETREGGPIHDVQALPRPRHDASLAGWLHPATVPDAVVSADIVARILAGVACGGHDPADAEAWVAPDGRFRFGALAGAWIKPEAVYIGFAARAAARARRLTEIAERLGQLAGERIALRTRIEGHAQAEQDAAEEWRNAPSDEALRQAQLVAAACARDFVVARERLDQAEAQYREAEQAARAARQTLIDAATDLRLPDAADALRDIEAALGRFDEAQQRLAQAARELRAALPELQRQQAREAETRADRQQRREQLSACLTEAAEADARWEELREAVGAKVEELQQRLADAVQAVTAGEQVVSVAVTVLRQMGEARAVADTLASAAETTLRERIETRTEVVGKFRNFAATGLLSAALPEARLPDLDSPWTIDPALTLARHVEQALINRNDGDEAWARIQRQISEDFSEMQRALTALGHQVQAETGDYGLVVNIIYQNRPERPDLLAGRLAEEIAHRQELLTANEREVLENHLQAEIATELQRLLQAAERQVDAINKELHKRPTSTGVRYRLQWQPLAETAEGAPVGLDAARRRLLNTSTDLWSAEDRRVVGTMLQQRIAAERERGDASGAGSLLDQLARALDYRHWHEFRVQRWQDGQWRKLSGPASSGERALGLTVPLFAAVASFYSQSGYAHAPRLVLLDEAFAGIDSAARAHCMGLIREFDLDFVITSESEWACYAELPGVSICQLQRREGIDAVFVSRWTWDGRARVRDDDPDRRFAPA
jgi:uncharacterized protein (TIGR02680 family)